MNPLFAPLPLPGGATLKNRLVLAPLTNTQSHDDGTLSDDEYRWLTMRALGGFAAFLQTAAAVVAGGRRERLRLLPLQWLGHLASLVTISQALPAMLRDRWSGRELVWAKTARYRPQVGV